MRHCVNETVSVHESTGTDIGSLLTQAAELADKHDGYVNVHTTYDSEEGYILTVYLHG